MACRIKNLTGHTLLVDLQNGQVLPLRKNETSPPMREELLYGNCYLAEWEREGLIVRLHASMNEVLEEEKAKGAKAAEPSTIKKESRKSGLKEKGTKPSPSHTA